MIVRVTFFFLGKIQLTHAYYHWSSKGGPLVFDNSDGTTVQVGVVSFETGGENGKLI